jgi:hypothetical protein
VAGLRTEARFPGVAREAGHYESFYVKACRPGGGLGVWIRHTVLKRPGEEPVGSVWFTLFDAAAGAPVASKASGGELGSGPDHYIRVGDARFEPGRLTGRAASEPLDAAWDLALAGDDPPFHYLPRGWMYRARIPRTKALSPYPAARLDGWLQAGERRVEVDGWVGMVGHNWGSEHAERWIWMHGTSFDDDPEASLDVAIGRVRLGPVTLPWIANGRLRLGGREHRLGGPERVRSTQVSDRPDGCEFQLPGDGATVRGTVGAPRERFVGWRYASPDGHEHEVANCSVADMELTVARPGEPDVRLRCSEGAAYELGMRERDHGIALQPFGDP